MGETLVAGEKIGAEKQTELFAKEAHVPRCVSGQMHGAQPVPTILSFSQHRERNAFRSKWSAPMNPASMR